MLLEMQCTSKEHELCIAPALLCHAELSVMLSTPRVGSTLQTLLAALHSAVLLLHWFLVTRKAIWGHILAAQHWRMRSRVNSTVDFVLSSHSVPKGSL